MSTMNYTKNCLFHEHFKDYNLKKKRVHYISKRGNILRNITLKENLGIFQDFIFLIVAVLAMCHTSFALISFAVHI